MKASNPSARQLQIELLRTRAEVERLSFRRDACSFLSAARPDRLMAQAGAGLRHSSLGWLASGWRLVRRYPLILSAASAVFTRARRGNPYVRLGIGALVAWRMLRRRD